MSTDTQSATKRASVDIDLTDICLLANVEEREAEDRSSVGAAEEPEVTGFLNPQPLPPGIVASDQLLSTPWSPGVGLPTDCCTGQHFSSSPESGGPYPPAISAL